MAWTPTRRRPIWSWRSSRASHCSSGSTRRVRWSSRKYFGSECKLPPGLAAAHAQGLVHRDIKPANIMLENGVERVRITDFGLARAVDDASVTQRGAVAGTPQYMAPEQAQGESVDQRADLFALGSTIYAMCTGRAPFRGDSGMAVIRQVCDVEPPSIRSINPDVPAWLEGIVRKLHAKDPAQRFQSADEVADLLGRCLAHVQQPDQHPQPWPTDEPPVAATLVRRARHHAGVRKCRLGDRRSRGRGAFVAPGQGSVHSSRIPNRWQLPNLAPGLLRPMQKFSEMKLVG